MLANLGLEEIAAGLLPTSNVTNLTLTNCLLMDDYPGDLASMNELTQLYGPICCCFPAFGWDG